MSMKAVRGLQKCYPEKPASSSLWGNNAQKLLTVFVISVSCYKKRSEG